MWYRYIRHRMSTGNSSIEKLSKEQIIQSGEPRLFCSWELVGNVCLCEIDIWCGILWFFTIISVNFFTMIFTLIFIQWFFTFISVIFHNCCIVSDISHNYFLFHLHSMILQNYYFQCYFYNICFFIYNIIRAFKYDCLWYTCIMAVIKK